LTTADRNILDSDLELISTMITKLYGIFAVLVVAHLDGGNLAVQEIQSLVLGMEGADALNRGCTTVLGASEAKVVRLNLEHAGNLVDGIHGIFVLLVKSEMEIIASHLLERRLGRAVALATCSRVLGEAIRGYGSDYPIATSLRLYSGLEDATDFLTRC
jgi:hypothetical protein